MQVRHSIAATSNVFARGRDCRVLTMALAALPCLLGPVKVHFIVTEKPPVYCCDVKAATHLHTTPSDKDRQRLTKSRRTTLATSKPSEPKTSKIASSSSEVESSEAETDARIGRKTGGRHGNKPAAAAATAVSPAICICH